MTTSSDPPRLAGEDGFTLVELLVAMMLSILVLAGILTTLDQFSSNAARQTRLTDANDQVRKAMDRIVADIRQAKTIQYADADDLVYTVAASEMTTRRERVCLDTSKRLWRSSVVYSAAPAAITSATPCPTPSVGASMITPLISSNSALFSYDASPTPDGVRSIGLTFAFKAGTVGHTDTSVLRASAFRRAKSETATAPPVTITTSCNSADVPTMTLTSSAGPVTVKYTDTAGNVLGTGAGATTSVLLDRATPMTTTVLVNITTATGILSELVKVLTC
jgi:type II secretory pathway pseudopilin PulG